jgi:hypothetical protein
MSALTPFFRIEEQAKQMNNAFSVTFVVALNLTLNGLSSELLTINPLKRVINLNII